MYIVQYGVYSSLKFSYGDTYILDTVNNKNKIENMNTVTFHPSCATKGYLNYYSKLY